MKKVITNRLFMATFVSDMLSNFGDVLYYLALMNMVLLVPETKLAIALVTVSESFPYLTMVFMGMWGDKTRNKVDRILATQLFRVVLYMIVAYAMGSKPALWIVIVAVLVNVLSDLSGQYENALYMPLSLRIVSDEDREAMYAFRQGTSSVLRIIFQSSGALLVGIMTYQQLAFFNAGTFLVSAVIMLVLRPSLLRLLKKSPISFAESTSTANPSRHFVSDLWKALKEAFIAVDKIPSLKASILAIAGLNAIFAAEDALILLTIREHADFMIVNPAVTLAAFSISSLAGMISGSILTTRVFKEVSFKLLLRAAVLMSLLLFVGYLCHAVGFVLLIHFLALTICGVFNPKMNALVVRSLPENRLATIGAGIDSFCTLGMVVSRWTLSVLVTVLSAETISLIFVLLSLALLGYTISIKKY
ncbi:TPA: MFS transporter [Streptococcus equi subsp. zooepidemicus]|nr:MFS transporter [Streptococcus equi subsp. zooepidemicus]HEL1315621.1 MFS transporter [Streptococcus equi subsp. zooepidemicus]